MPSSRNLTRQKIIQAAIELFASQGVNETTTKQIAELAQVNEVTLFRQFGNKHGLLLAVIEDADVFAQLGQSLTTELPPASSLAEMLRAYATTCLQALEQTPAVIRSLVGESGQYSTENRQGLGRSFDRANRRVAKYLKTNIGESQSELQLPIEQLTSLLHTLLFGYATIELTSEFHGLWRDRSDFLDRVVALFVTGAVAENSRQLTATNVPENRIIQQDLPESIVHQILQQAKKHSLQTYALVYVLFGAGLSANEIISLTRSNHLSSSDRQLLQITHGAARQVPVNQWILGKRYGSYLKNPLTQWLRSRKDSHPSLFINSDGNALTEADLHQLWQQSNSELLAPTGEPPTIQQAQATWCVEMLIRGLSIEAMQVLTGWETSQLEPYVLRAKELTVLAQAFNVDTSQRSHG
ncbi:TetR family transcriptional regulator [Chamaesiphon minutus]|uniref:Transcriptional regulator n=1 Tax=Chamaesiphon minutus (strain ATCC 27169 / PCC 6605) TaxID=1173020 RepID=K9UPL9_CHAP6|nr:TetR family transcriptional regulator [Chamaesiphon minutus]AFY96361.1 transcriptional regulator [Chamaesiphon minutus PCC 6605]